MIVPNKTLENYMNIFSSSIKTSLCLQLFLAPQGGLKKLNLGKNEWVVSKYTSSQNKCPL